MAIEDFLKTNATIIIWITHGLVLAYTYGKGIILGREVNEIFVYAAVCLSFYIYHLLRKELTNTLNTILEKEKEEKKIEKKPTRPEDKPFGFDVGDEK